LPLCPATNRGQQEPADHHDADAEEAPVAAEFCARLLIGGHNPPATAIWRRPLGHPELVHLDQPYPWPARSFRATITPGP